MSDIIVTEDASILEVTLNRPKKKNALTFAMYEVLAGALRSANTNRNVRVVLLSAAGDAFCAGNDIGDFMSNGGVDPVSAPPVRFIEALVRLEKPLVAAVHGAAVGIGTTLLLHADLAYASEAAQFSTPFVALGLVPEAASSLLLSQRVGQAAASDMLVRGAVISGTRAAAIGLVNEVVPSADEVLALARSRARELAAKPPAALRLTKSILRPDPATVLERVKLEAALFAERVPSDEAREAFTAFFEKRPPDFSRLS
jgi:enoyl-CoA hydratase/carnithine racemase